MRVLHIVHQYPPEWVGGTELYTQSLACELTKRGHEIAVFTKAFSLAPGVSQESGIEVWRASGGTRAPIKRFHAGFTDHATVERFTEAIDLFRPELVHVQHMLGLPLSLLDVLQSKGIPYLVTLHDYWWFCPNAQLLRNDSADVCNAPGAVSCSRCAFARAGLPTQLAYCVTPVMRLRSYLTKQKLKAAQLLISPSQFVLDCYRKEIGQDCPEGVVLEHGITGVTAAVKNDIADWNSGSALKVFYLGGLSEQKGVHILLEALAKLPNKEGVRLYIGGVAGPEGKNYELQLQEMAKGLPVTFLGKLTREQVFQWLTVCDILTVPSIWQETFALVVSEAYLAGKPVIVSDIGALAERVRNGVDGLLVAPGAALEWRDALQALITNPALLEKLRTGVKPPLSLSQHVDTIEDVYKRVLI